MPELRWVNAAANHRAALDRFVCTEPESQQYDRYRGRWHPRPWELEVQSHLRGLRLPVPPGAALLLGFDPGGDGLAGAIHFGFEETGAHFMIWAVARDLRFAGRGVGREAVGQAMRSLRATKDAHSLSCGVITHIDPRNDASRAVFQAAGFEYLGSYDGYEAWVSDV